MSSQRFKYFDFTAPAEDFDGHTLVMTMNQEIDGGIDQPQVVNLYVIHVLRKNRMIETNLPFRGAHAHTQAGAQKEEDRAGRPGLRSAGHGIKCRPTGTGPLVEAAEKFREALEFDVATDFK